MSHLSDTSPEVERMLAEIFRNMPVAEKWRQLGDAYRTAKVLHAAGVRARNPNATIEEIHEAWLAATLGESTWPRSGSPVVEQQNENLQILQEVTTALDGVGIPYALGGSMASSLQGRPRFTQDADIMVEPFAGREAALIAQFGPDYYISLPAVQEAVRLRSPFNILHPRTGFKVDVFVRKDRAFEHSVMARRRSVSLPAQPGRDITIVSPEDVILLKLEWYRLGGEISDQQWKDVLGVLQAQAGRLDDGYLDQWAEDLGVSDLLIRAREETAS
jgi:hypothetical protein